MAEGIAGLLRDKRWRPRKAPLAAAGRWRWRPGSACARAFNERVRTRSSAPLTVTSKWT
jgi:hypothetical protein